MNNRHCSLIIVSIPANSIQLARCHELCITRQVWLQGMTLCSVGESFFFSINTLISFFAFFIFNSGEKYIPEDLWGGSYTVPSRRRGNTQLLLWPAARSSSQASTAPQECRYLLMHTHAGWDRNDSFLLSVLEGSVGWCWLCYSLPSSGLFNSPLFFLDHV